MFLPKNNIMVFHFKLVIHRKTNVLVPPSFLRTVTVRKPVRAPLFSFFLPLTLAFLVPSFQSIFPVSSFVISLSLSYGYMSCYVIEDVFVFVLLMCLPLPGLRIRVTLMQIRIQLFTSLQIWILLLLKC